MTIKQNKKLGLFKSKGELMNLISQLPTIEGEKASKLHYELVESLINQIMLQAIDLTLDFPDIAKELISSNNDKEY